MNWIEQCFTSPPRHYRVFQKNCTKLKHHNFATVHHRVMPFSAKCSEEHVYTTKASVWIRQLNILCYSAGNYLKTKQSTWWYITFCFHIGINAIILAVRKCLHGKNILIQEPSTTDRALSHTFLQMIASLNRFSLSAAVRDLTSRRRNTTNHSWQFSQLKNVKFQSLSASPVNSYLSLVVLLDWELSH